MSPVLMTLSSMGECQDSSAKDSWNDHRLMTTPWVLRSQLKPQPTVLMIDGRQTSSMNVSSWSAVAQYFPVTTNARPHMRRIDEMWNNLSQCGRRFDESQAAARLFFIQQSAPVPESCRDNRAYRDWTVVLSM